MKKKIKFNKMFTFKIVVILSFITTLLIMRANEIVFKTYSEGANMLDMQLGYKADYVHQIFRRLGQEGRLLYIKLLSIDFLFIVSFALVQNYILRRIMSKAMLNSRWRLLLFISYLRGLFDVIENIFILIMLFGFPMEFSRLVIVASFVTTLKFIFFGLWLIAIPLSFFVRKQIGNNILKGID